ncbi:U-box domain-containing protein 43 [Dorcoceras hygrometricum]|uniref:U-box domain-containing protein 43 n=1 Tax=Dorcoceras hygrometricum TaxID=472368 RepID=A0A2Z7BTQ3_9LAMI|nr:U-box domain-containing protein 43 [Dorcoceras hygrometricum]
MAVIDVMKSADVILCFYVIQFVELFELYILLSRIELCVVPEKSNAIIGVVTAGFERLSTICDGLTGSEDHGPMISPVDTSCGDSAAKPILPCLPEVELVSSNASSVYRSPSPQSRSSSSNHLDFHIISPTDEEVFATTDVGSTPTVAPFCLPPAVSDSFNDLRTSMSRIISNQSKESRRLDDSHLEVLDKIKQLEKTIRDAFYQQNQVFHRLITGIRQEANNDTTAFSLGLKAVRTQTAILSTDQANARKEAKEQKAIIVDMDERLATLRSEQLDFRAQAQENYNNLSSQLGELVAYINRGNDKRGEDSSSRRPQPPPDDLNRPSGGNASRGGGGGSGESGRRDDRKGSSTKRGSGSSSAGGTYKKSVEWWLYGKNQF